jgi:polyisoprenoid-binding protein YceI
VVVPDRVPRVDAAQSTVAPPDDDFRSTPISEGRRGWLVDGDLTIDDITWRFTLDLEFGGIETFMDGTRHAGFAATGGLGRSDFGIDFPCRRGSAPR